MSLFRNKLGGGRRNRRPVIDALLSAHVMDKSEEQTALGTSVLAMDSFMRTSFRAYAWLEESIGPMHDLDHIIDTVSSCVEKLKPGDEASILHPNEAQLEYIRKIDRCFHVLENVSYLNRDNLAHLKSYKDSVLIKSSVSLLEMFEHYLTANVLTKVDTPEESDAPKKVESVVSCFQSVLKVLRNITTDNLSGRYIVESTELVRHVLRCIVKVPNAISSSKRNDFLVLLLGVLINLVDRCSENAKQIAEIQIPGSFDSIDGNEMPAIQALVKVLISEIEAASQSEEEAKSILIPNKNAAGYKDSSDKDSGSLPAEETLNEALQKAENYKEHTISAVFISVLLGCMIENNKEYSYTVRGYLPEGSFAVIFELMKRFHSSAMRTNVICNLGEKSIERIWNVFQST